MRWVLGELDLVGRHSEVQGGRLRLADLAGRRQSEAKAAISYLTYVEAGGPGWFGNVLVPE